MDAGVSLSSEILITAMRAPFLANCKHVSRPIPLSPPVTMATFFCS